VAAAGIRVPGGLDLEQAHDVFGRVAGPAAALVFAVALLASSLASSLVGVYSGQVIMQGFLRRGVPILLRRLVCTVPPLVVLGLGVDATSALVLSQVVLAFGIPFAVVPLVVFTSDRELMGELVNRRATTLAAGAVVAVIIALNAFLLVQLVR
jgi:manganese transport protein